MLEILILYADGARLYNINGSRNKNEQNEIYLTVNFVIFTKFSYRTFSRQDFVAF
jgi:hypothetical protein